MTRFMTAITCLGRFVLGIIGSRATFACNVSKLSAVVTLDDIGLTIARKMIDAYSDMTISERVLSFFLSNFFVEK